MASINLRQRAARLLLAPQHPTTHTGRISWNGSHISTSRTFSNTAARTTDLSQAQRKAAHTVNRAAGASPKNKQGSAERNAVAVEHLTKTLSVGTYVSPPFTRFPMSWKFAWTLSKRRFLDYLALFLFAFGSKPKFFRSATWKPKQSALLTQARALHRTMGEALAAGNKHTLRQICITPLANRLCDVIDSRARGKRKSWELVHYNQTWRYPRVADRKLRLSQHPSMRNLPAIYQAVVTIASRQRLVEYDDSPKGGGRVVPGSEKEVDLVEHVVLITSVDPDSYKQAEWKIWGTIKETTAESLEYEEQTLSQLQDVSV